MAEQSHDTPPQYAAATRAVHTGVYKDAQYRSVTTPIYTTSTFAFDGVSGLPPFDYTRSGNPTRQALNENLAGLEGGTHAEAVCSGMAAITLVLMQFSAGDHVVCGHEIYGGSHRLFSQVLPRFGLTFTHVDMTDLAAVEAAITKETRLIWIETPTNPLLNIVDLEGVSAIAKKYGLRSALDNTFLTPLQQSAFAYGIDYSVHSTTKYLNGHSDMIGGAVIVKDAELGKGLYFLVNALGIGASPFDSWLCLRGIKTLEPRLACHQRNALAIAEALQASPLVKRVFYPGLASHPQHALAKRQQSGFGGMLSFELDLYAVDIDVFLKALNLYSMGVSLGGVESLIEQPWSMSHLAIPREGKLAAGITAGILRISAGIEAAEDLVTDVLHALEQGRR